MADEAFYFPSFHLQFFFPTLMESLVFILVTSNIFGSFFVH